MNRKTEESTIIEGFRVLKMKQEIQEEIFRETEKMTPEELCEYFRAGGSFFSEQKHTVFTTKR